MNARSLHNQALEKRESGDALESLLLDTKALLAYQEEGNKSGFAEVLADKSITLRHLFEKTEDKTYLILSKAELEASVEIARLSGDKTALALPLFQLARTLEALEQFDEAVETYHQALSEMEQNPPQSHANRPAVLADFKIHLYTCSVRAGNDEDLEKATQAIAELEDIQEEDSFTKHVWLSGGYMRLAHILRTSDPEKSKQALGKATQVIESDDRLVVRAKQLEKLKQYLNK